MTDAPLPQSPSAGAYPALHRLDVNRRKRLEYVPQMQVADCGAASLTCALRYFGRHARLDDVRAVLGVGRDGATLGGMRRAAEHFGLRARGVRTELADVRALPRATILHWNLAHFVVLDRATPKGVQIVDPANGPRLVSWEQFGKSYTGVALVLEPTEAFAPMAKGGNRLFAYLAALLGHRGTLTRVLTMSVLLRVLAISLPLLTALVVDRVIPRSDTNLLMVTSVGLVAVIAFQFVSQLIRAHLLLELRTNLDVRLTLGFLEHMVSLPFVFFQTRSAGDLMMRVNSNTQMRELLTSNTLSALLDGTLVVVYLAMILVMSPLLGAVVTVLAAIQIVLFWLTKTRYRELSSQQLEAQAQTHGYLVQLIAGIETLKAAGAERNAVVRWSNLFARALNVGLERGRLEALVNALLAAVKAAAPLVVLCTGAVMTMRGEITLGVMLALNALAAGFLTPLGTLVDNLVTLQGLTSYIERIDDVMGEAPEQDAARVQPAPRLTGHIRLSNVSFRYAGGAPLVVRGASLEIVPGMKVALVGRSGSGKSTLASLMLGLYWPEQGSIEFDGRDLRQLDVRTVRQQMGIVTQDPYIFAGSIKDNLLLNAPDASPHQMMRAAQIARIHEDVMAMPMGYQTPVAEGGASLSGGQRQRLALARALVNAPAVLLLDEATSALDAVTEAEIARNLSQLQCTQIIIAHRLSTIMSADAIVVVDGGQILEAGSHADLLARGGHYRRLVEAQAMQGSATQAPPLRLAAGAGRGATEVAR
ncbi:MAG: peptidase domain-containing ABC transporter [Myxococcales bacterium]|nr:peptidase domain-containing ABC transporter [Myxococcales bacterium]